MKLNKKKVFTLALAVCLIAILSMGSLAWFTDNDSVNNDFFIAGSEDENPDDVFSIDVWEDKTPEDPNGEEKIQDGISYPAILPGDDLYKEVNVENTGAYPQYARVIVTVSDAHIWQQLHGEVYVPLNKIATDLSADFSGWSTEFNADEDTLTYVLYYKDILVVDQVVTLFTNVAIPEEMDRYQAAEMAGGFDINVVAQAVQTEHVGDNAAAAFQTVGMAIDAGNSTIMTTATGLKNALRSGALSEVTLGAEYANTQITIDYDVANVTIDVAGQDVKFVVTGLVENVTIENIVGNGQSLNVGDAAPGSSVTIKNSTLVNGGSTSTASIKPGKNCDLTVDGCAFSGPKYAMYNSGNCGGLTVTNCTFEGIDGWVFMTNGTLYGDVTFDGNTFTNCSDGIAKGSVGGGEGNGMLNGNFTFTNNTLNNCQGHDGKDSKMFEIKKVTGVITVAGNTRDGANFNPDESFGIKQGV